MRALIVGGNGALGSAVARHASALGIDTHVAVRATSDRARLTSVPGVRGHVVMLSEPESVRALVASLGPDWILMAAFPGPVWEEDPDRRRAILHEMSGNLFGLLQGVSRAGYSGTLSWLGSALYCARADNEAARDDDASSRPRTFRGAAKASEIILAAQMATELGIPFTELRVFTGYGPFEQRERLVPSLLRAALTGAGVRLSAKPSRRDWIHYSDIAAACIASSVRRSRAAEVHNVCSGVVHTTREVAQLLEQISGRTLVAPGHYEVRERYGNAVPGILSTSSEFGWSPRIDLREGLARCWDWARSTQGRAWLLNDARVPA